MTQIHYTKPLDRTVTINDCLNYYKESANTFPELSTVPEFNEHLNLLVRAVDCHGTEALVTSIGDLQGELEVLPNEIMVVHANWFVDDVVQWSWE